MKAFVFAAGKGTRLKPWTDNHPKALAEVNGMSMLERVIQGISERSSVDSFIVNVHHFANQIIDHISDSKFLKNKIIDISDETSELLETGGALLKAKNLIEDEDIILVHNSDILTDFDYQSIISEHKKQGNDITLLVNDRDSSRKLLFGSNMLLEGWKNFKTGEEIKISGSNPENIFSFAGIHIISTTILEYLETYSKEHKTHSFGLIPFYLWSMDKIKIRGYKHPSAYRWIDIGKPEALEISKTLFRE